MTTAKSSQYREGPLKGVRIVEFAGIGPAPFACMLLADLGADIIRVDRAGAPDPTAKEVHLRGRPTLKLDLKSGEARETCLRLCAKADILIEGFRPGVMERLGLGPEAVLEANPALVYGRMTGWGQDGPLAQAAGHDLNYIALTGALDAIGTPERPVPPLNLVGDFGGGSLYLIMGVLAALTHARTTGEGQVVDAAIVDGASSLMGIFHWLKAEGLWGAARGRTLLDGGAPFYDVYKCSDGKFISVAGLEPHFYAKMLEIMGLENDPVLARRDDPAAWGDVKVRLAEIFVTKTRAEWTELLEGSDACFAPVLSLEEVPEHPHMKARGSVVERDGQTQPAPAPRFSRTPGEIHEGGSADAAMERWGLG